ncbi:hypothetical protein AB7Z32_23920 [Bradyrhizobium sp. 482_C4_N1_1]|uniref:hypothetical protein n=1 Tax=unclassified Bradyrhizobium TaxID=2631580 RepID=UPI003F8938DC
MSKSKALQVLSADRGEFLTAKVIDVLGGNPAVVAITGGEPSAISNWRRQHTFPSNTHNLLRAALAAKGYCVADPDALWRMKTEARGA